MNTHQSWLKPRNEYLQRLITFREKMLIKVVTGVRRSGKSTLFALYIDYLRQQGVREDQIISINLDELEYEELLTYRYLYSYISERLPKDRYTYIFIDEVQQCKGFEKAVNSLYIKDNVDIYITGSNARLLSGELATLLSGRYVEIQMLPLSFREYLTFIHGNNESLTTSFIRYMQDGSFPYIPMLNREEQAVKGYIEGIYNTILVKDVAIRKGITDISVLEQIVRFLGSAIGSPISAKKIADTIASTGRKISVNTVDTYLKALVDSYIFYKVDRFDIKGKNFLKTLGKYYIVDLGLRNTLLVSSEPDTGHQIENIVYLELLRRGYSVSIGKVGEREVDFVAIRQKKISYYQVSATVLDERTLRRELAPLQAITDNYPKTLLTLDEIGAGNTYGGIVQKNLLQWLTEDV
ncbi:MAG: ATP-binding protein [Sphaerochaeta sp.]